MSWSWSFVPQRLMSEDAFLELSPADRGILLSLYLRCDKWGRGPGGLRALATLLGVDRAGLAEAMGRLYAAGLVESLHGDWQLVRYDEDAKPVGVLKRRQTPSAFGQPEGFAPVANPEPETPSKDVQQRPTPSDNVGQRPAKSDDGRQRPAQMRRDEMREPKGSLSQREDSAVVAPPEPAPGGAVRGAAAPVSPGPRLPSPAPPLSPAAITEDHPDPAGLQFVPTAKQQACMALRWATGNPTPEHAEVLLAWAKECGVPETRLKRWLVRREGHDPWPKDWPQSKRTRRSKAPEEIYP